jgi:uncharacterized protein (DUF885 family)
MEGMSATNQTRAIFAIADEYVEEVASLDPFEATSMGVPGHDHEVTDFSPEALARRAALIKRTLGRLERATPADRDETIARAVMQDALGDELVRIDAGDPYYELNTIASPVQRLREVFDLMPLTTERDWQAVIQRLNALPESAASIQARLTAGVRRGRVVARRQVEAVLGQLTRFAGDDPSVLPAFSGLPAQLARSKAATPALYDRLERAIATGREAFRALRAFLVERYLANATVEEAAGRGRYARAARQFLGIDLDLEDTYAWGWEEVARLAAEMRVTAHRIAPGASLREAADLLDADPGRTIEGEAALIAWLQSVQDTAVRNLDGSHFDIPEPVKRIEARIAPPGGALAQYYTQPSEDFSRPGRTWYPTGGKTAFHRWRDTTVAYHEGVPGHHLQCATAVYQAEHLSRFQRLALWYPGYGEGWALYAERLMAELGYLDDPGDYLGMLIGQMHRAVRVVVDLGMHLQLPIPAASAFAPGERWTYERMLSFLMEQAALPLDEAQSEVVRYLGWPAQAIAYKVGERTWLSIREERRAHHGADFSLKSFHTTALNIGPMGLDLLRETMRTAY